MLQVVENCEGYEALYVEGKLTDEGNPLNEGTERVIYFNRLCYQYTEDMLDIEFGYSDCEEFPLDIKELEDITWQDNSL